MRDNITALWARTTAESILGEKVKKQIDTCLDSIENTVKKNEMNCSVNIHADAMVIKELVKRGFSVKQCDDQRDGVYLTISW